MVELAQVVNDDARCRRLVSVGPKPSPRFCDGSEMEENEERALHQAAIALCRSLGAGYTEAYVNVIRDRLVEVGVSIVPFQCGAFDVDVVRIAAADRIAHQPVKASRLLRAKHHSVGISAAGGGAGERRSLDAGAAVMDQLFGSK